MKNKNSFNILHKNHLIMIFILLFMFCHESLKNDDTKLDYYRNESNNETILEIFIASKESN